MNAWRLRGKRVLTSYLVARFCSLCFDIGPNHIFPMSYTRLLAATSYFCALNISHWLSTSLVKNSILISTNDILLCRRFLGIVAELPSKQKVLQAILLDQLLYMAIRMLLLRWVIEKIWPTYVCSDTPLRCDLFMVPLFNFGLWVIIRF